MIEDLQKTREQLIAENGELRRRLATLESAEAEGKRTEDALRQSEARYRALAESTRDIIYILDRQGTLLYANRAASHCISIGLGELVGKRQADLFPSQVAGAHLERIARVFATGEPLETDELFHFGSEELWLRVHLLPLRDEGGQITSLMGVCHNITDRKRAETALKQAHDELERRVDERTAELKAVNDQLQREIEERQQIEDALRQSERRFRNYFEQGLIGMAVTSVDKHWLEVNDRLCEMLGYSREELAQTDWATLTHPDDIESNLRLFNPLVAGEIKGFTLDKRYIKKDGSLVYVTIHTRAFRNAAGTIDHIVTLIEDITARKQAEAGLRESHQELQAIYGGLRDGVLLAESRTKRFVQCNQAMCEMLGYSQEELLSLSVDDIHPPESLPYVLHRFQQQVEGRLRLADDVPVLRRDRTVFYADIAASLLDYRGRPCVIGFFRDVTERHRAQEALERERQSLWQMLQASDHERQTISYEIHDGLAQYLAAAGMQFQTFERLRPSNPEEAQKAYNAAVQLVSQSHLESRRLISEVRPPVIDEIGLETAISHLVHEQRRRGGATVRFDSNVQFDRLPAILENGLYRIAQEALTNACKYSKSKKVTVTLAQEGHDVRLEVQDWGIGFDPHAVGKGHFGLEGIRQRVRLLGGRLTIESQPGSGTTVRVVMPVVEK